MIYLDTLETKIPRTDKNSSETYSIRLTNIQTNESKIIDSLVDNSTYLYYYQFDFDKTGLMNGQYELDVISDDKVVYTTLAQVGDYTKDYKKYNNNKTTYKVYKS